MIRPRELDGAGTTRKISEITPRTDPWLKRVGPLTSVSPFVMPAKAGIQYGTGPRRVPA
jgi:hypothetical protein